MSTGCAAVAMLHQMKIASTAKFQLPGHKEQPVPTQVSAVEFHAAAGTRVTVNIWATTW